MKPSIALATHREGIRRIVEANRAENPRIFGSVLHGDDHDESDIDILVDPTPEMSLFDLGAITYELGELLGTRVDVLTPKALPPKFRDKVISEARSI